MKTGFGLFQKVRNLYTQYNCFRFWWRNKLLGFEVANQFLQRADKQSVLMILRNNGAVIGVNCDIETGLVFHNCHDYSNLTIGDNCHIGKNCFFDLRDKVIIGNNVVISMQCSFIAHIDLNKSPLSVHYPSVHQSINICDGCYIGAGVRVLMGVEIGEKAFIAANSLVTKNIPEFAFAAGSPAKVKKSRNELFKPKQ